MANSRKNLRLKDQYEGFAARYIAGSVEVRIRSLTDKQELQKSVYMAVATEATTELWSDGMRHAALAVLKEMFDGNCVTLDHVIRGADERFRGLVDTVGDIFDRIVSTRPDVAHAHNLAGLHRHRLQNASLQDAF